MNKIDSRIWELDLSQFEELNLMENIITEQPPAELVQKLGNNLQVDRNII